MIFGKCRKGGNPGEKIVTVPANCNIGVGEVLAMKKIDAEDFDNIFYGGKKNAKRK